MYATQAEDSCGLIWQKGFYLLLIRRTHRKNQEFPCGVIESARWYVRILCFESDRMLHRFAV